MIEFPTRRSRMAESSVPPNASDAWRCRQSRSIRIRGRSASRTPTYQTQFRRRFPGAVSAASSSPSCCRLQTVVTMIRSIAFPSSPLVAGGVSKSDQLSCAVRRLQAEGISSLEPIQEPRRRRASLCSPDTARTMPRGISRISR
jgi:hypothetical protein